MALEDDTPREFTDEDLERTLHSAAVEVRNEVFAAGLAMPFIEGDRLLLRHANGQVEDLGPASKAATAQRGEVLPDE